MMGLPELFHRFRCTASNSKGGSYNGYANLDKVYTDTTSIDGGDDTGTSDKKYQARQSQEQQLLLQDMLAITRDVVDRWVCETCMAFHPVCRSDSPTRPHRSTCPLGWQSSPHNAYGHPSFRLSHRHVQMTLKYLRLKKWRHRLHLHRLLRDSHAPFMPNPRCTALTGEFSAYPKIVHGRYLLLTTWTFFEGSDRVTEQGMGSLRICEHQSFVGDPRLNPNRGEDDEKLAPDTTLSRIIARAFKHHNHEIRTSCPLCPTDFSVQVHPDRAIVRVWQDFGGDGSPLDPAWTIHTASDDDDDDDDGYDRYHLRGLYSRSVEHRDGSIREAFGHCMREALREIRNRKEGSESQGPGIMF